MSYSYSLVFLAGLTGGFHCLGMCGGLAGGFFVGYGWQQSIRPIIAYNAMRILGYTLLGVTGALLGQVVAQMGITGKFQGIVQMLAGLLITFLGLYLTGIFRKSQTCPSGQSCSTEVPVAFLDRGQPVGHRAPAIAGLLNGLVPCALVFSVALKAAETGNPLQAATLMLVFGLGTLPTLVLINTAGTLLGHQARGWLSRVAGVFVMLLGLWTFMEGWQFFSIMKGLANW